METLALARHQGTYNSVFQHPIARNLQWRDLHLMLGSICDETEMHGGGVRFARNGESLTVHPPKHKDFSDLAELMSIRHFLERSEAPAASSPANGAHLLVVVDHREARVFRSELHGSIPQRIVPLDPNGSGRYLHQVEQDASGQRKPEAKAYYDAIARSLAGAQQILILGSSTGGSSAMDHLVSELNAHHPEVAKRVVGALVVNAARMSEDQLLAAARAFYQGR